MNRKIRVCGECLRPVATVRFILIIGCVCPVHGRIAAENTVKIPEDKANYQDLARRLGR